MTHEGLNNLITLKQILLQTPHAHENGSKTHVIIRCPVCGDSRTHSDAAHCYVNIEGGKPVTYYCFLCSEGHYVNSNFLRSLNITDLSLITSIWKYNRSFFGKEMKTIGRVLINANKRGIVPVYEKCIYDYKLKYIENRLGINLTYKDLPKYKIILSLKDFITMNALPLNIKPEIAERLETDHVGFLSADTSYIIFRNIKSNSNYRYMNYPVFKNSNQWGSKSYIMPSEFDIMADNIELNISEGIFDILGCFFNVKNQERRNTLYGAVNGAGFLGFVRKVISLGFIDNLNINIYSDNDKPITWFKNLTNLKPFYKSLSIWYNHYPNQKDIGVVKEFIDVRKAKFPY